MTKTLEEHAQAVATLIEWLPEAARPLYEAYEAEKASRKKYQRSAGESELAAEAYENRVSELEAELSADQAALADTRAQLAQVRDAAEVAVLSLDLASLDPKQRRAVSLLAAAIHTRLTMAEIRNEIDEAWRERIRQGTCMPNGPRGPECWCGAPSEAVSGLCWKHAYEQLMYEIMDTPSAQPKPERADPKDDSVCPNCKRDLATPDQLKGQAAAVLTMTCFGDYGPLPMDCTIWTHRKRADDAIQALKLRSKFLQICSDQEYQQRTVDIPMWRSRAKEAEAKAADLQDRLDKLLAEGHNNDKSE